MAVVNLLVQNETDAAELLDYGLQKNNKITNITTCTSATQRIM